MKLPMPRSTPRKKGVATEDIFALIGKAEHIEEAAAALQAMAHPIRIKVLCLLFSGEMAVQELTESIGTTQSNISQHLRVLRSSGLVEVRREGTRAYYCVRDPRILKLVALTRDVFCKF